jgi:uncharacterized protein (DUF58 family)
MRPTKFLIGLVLAWLGISVAVALLPALLPLWWGAGGLIVVLALADAVLGRSVPHLAVSRATAGSWPLGVWQAVTVKIGNRSARAVSLMVHDHYPAQAELELPASSQPGALTPLPKPVRIAPGQIASVPYRVRATARGDIDFGQVALRLASPFRLWEKQVLAGEPSRVRVYPNFAALTKFALLAVDNRLSQIGVLQRRRRGEGLDFHQLREYREGDSPRQIDWKASSRMLKLISREYRDERDQQIVFLIDCGRRMGAREPALVPGELATAHFDHALNAVLLLAYVALRQGDAVGFSTFATDSPRFRAPRKSGATVTALLYGLEPSTHSPDYYRAAVELNTRLKRRAMVVVISNLRDEDDDTLKPALALLKKKHLVMFASLKERVVDRLAEAPVTNLSKAMTYASARLYQRERAEAFRRISRQGALTLEAAPADLPIALVNRYLDAKRAGVL